MRAQEDAGSVSSSDRSRAEELEATGDVPEAALGQLAASVDAFCALDAKPGRRVDAGALLARMNEPTARGGVLN